MRLGTLRGQIVEEGGAGCRLQAVSDNDGECEKKKKRKEKHNNKQ